MACGNTGCGKSTMFNSLIYGTKALCVHQKIKEIDVNIGNQVKKKNKKVRVIDLTEQ